jgi:signal peptidase II
MVAAVVILDRATKLYIRSALPAHDSLPVIPGFFNIVHVENPGAAFGLLADSPGVWRTVVLVCVALVVLAAVGGMLWKRRPAGAAETALADMGLALIFAGALGNLWDRIFRGTVTDFLQFFFGSWEFPSFNVADIAINIGAGLLLVDLWRRRKRA